MIAAVLATVVLAGPTWSEAEAIPAAIGRISYGLEPGQDAPICSGVLVASDLVLTAAHCVRGSVEDPRSIRFDAGWSAAGPSGQGRGKAVILAGTAEAPELDGLVEDVALVVLDEPLPAGAFPPLALADPGSGPFTLIGFDRSARDRPRTDALCRPMAMPPGLIALDCPVVSGNSGAPLLVRDGVHWRVVAVMVAMSRSGPVRSWAALPPAPLRRRIPSPDGQSPNE